MKIRRLTPEAYTKFDKHSQTLSNKDRYYGLLEIVYKGHIFAIPFRSTLNHRYGFKTILSDGTWCGLDYSKCLIAKHSDFQPQQYKLRNDREFTKVKRNIHKITKEFGEYIDLYINHFSGGKSDSNLCKYSTLQYFHKELGIET